MCVEIIGLRNHIIINPNFIEPPLSGIDSVFLTHGHQKNCYLDCLNEIKENYASEEKELQIYGPKSVAKIHETIDITNIKENKSIRLANIELIPYKLRCEYAAECFAFVIIIDEDIKILHTANATQFSDRIRNYSHKIDYCFISCEKDHYKEYLDFLVFVFPTVIFPYNFKPGEEKTAKDFIEYLTKANLNGKYIKIGTEFEF
jgi:ribonuclease BN (tRNA processing enzyme)